MAKIYYSKLTDLGMELVTTAISTAAKIGIDQFAVGDGGGAYYAPTGAEPALKREKYRGSVQRVSILGSRIIMDAVIPTTSTGYTVREIGIFTEAGQMVAIGNLPDIPKDAVTDGAIGELLITMELQVANADVFELVVDPNTLLVTRPELEQSVLLARSQFYRTELLATRNFYYKAAATSIASDRPWAGDPIPADFVAFNVDVEIPWENETTIYIQVIKGVGGKISAWEEVGAIPTAGDLPADPWEASGELDVIVTPANGKMVLAAMVSDDGWQKHTDGHFTQTAVATGVTTDTMLSSAIVGIDDGTLTLVQKQAIAEALGYISELLPGDGIITFVCYESVPEVDMTVQVTEVR